jgi:hypothetical protein
MVTFFRHKQRIEDLERGGRLGVSDPQEDPVHTRVGGGKLIRKLIPIERHRHDPELRSHLCLSRYVDEYHLIDLLQTSEQTVLRVPDYRHVITF